MLKRREYVLEVSTTPIENIKALRLICEENEWEIESQHGSRLVDRFAIIMPMAQNARTIGIIIHTGPMQGLEMHSWAETKGSAGAINMASWIIPGGEVTLKRWIRIENGLNYYQGAHGNGHLVSEVESAIFYQYSDAQERNLPSLV